MAAGALQVMVGVLVEGAPGAATGVMVIWVDALKFCGVALADAGEVPAGVAST
jgi:hypothetical protein